jgi:hypothetical protein
VETVERTRPLGEPRRSWKVIERYLKMIGLGRLIVELTGSA